MPAAFGAGYAENAQDIRSAIANFARQELQLNLAIGGFARWLSQLTPAPQGGISKLEQAFLDDYAAKRPGADPVENAANAHADFLQATEWLQETIRDLQYATTQAGANGVGTASVTDNTAGSAAATITVPMGAKAYVTSDPTLLHLYDGVGVDTSPIINDLAPPQF